MQDRPEKGLYDVEHGKKGLHLNRPVSKATVAIEPLRQHCCVTLWGEGKHWRLPSHQDITEIKVTFPPVVS